MEPIALRYLALPIDLKRGIRFALRFGSGVGYGPCGAVGDIMVEYSDFRRKTEVSTPLLYYRASLERPEVWRSE